MAGVLEGKKVAFLAADGVERVELIRPWEALEGEGAELHLVSIEEGEIQAVNGMELADTFPVHRTAAQCDPSDYDALVIPGGVKNPDLLRMNRDAVELVRGFFEHAKPVSAICHAPWVLVEADVVRGRTLTSYPSLRTDIRNAGGEWVDREVVVDDGLTTSRKPDDLEAFIGKTIEEITEGIHAGQARSA
jgi:protease I